MLSQMPVAPATAPATLATAEVTAPTPPAATPNWNVGAGLILPFLLGDGASGLAFTGFSSGIERRVADRFWVLADGRFGFDVLSVVDPTSTTTARTHSVSGGAAVGVRYVFVDPDAVVRPSVFAQLRAGASQSKSELAEQSDISMSYAFGADAGAAVDVAFTPNLAVRFGSNIVSGETSSTTSEVVGSSSQTTAGGRFGLALAGLLQLRASF